MPRTPTPRPTSGSVLHHLQDCTSSIRSAAIDLDEQATMALFSAFPHIRDSASRRFAADLLRIRLVMADVERVLLARDQADGR